MRLALGLAGALLWVPYAVFNYAGRIPVKLALGCLAGAAIILWSVMPRPDRFEAPGPELEPAKHPKLFQMIRGVASATKQEMPAEVYLVGDMNAWVAHRGGLMGLGARGIMGLGLPLLQTLSVSELRAVLAHEFGHYHGGDTKLGRFVYGRAPPSAVRSRIWVITARSCNSRSSGTGSSSSASPMRCRAARSSRPIGSPPTWWGRGRWRRA